LKRRNSEFLVSHNGQEAIVEAKTVNAAIHRFRSAYKLPGVRGINVASPEAFNKRFFPKGHPTTEFMLMERVLSPQTARQLEKIMAK